LSLFPLRELELSTCDSDDLNVRKKHHKINSLKQSRFLRTFVGFLIAALFIFFAFRGISFRSMFHDALRANFVILTLTALLVLFSHLLRGLRWRVILQEINPETSVIDTWGGVMVGYLLNNFVPRLGEIVRAYITGRLESISVSGVLGTVVLERLFDFVSTGVLVGIALLSYHGTLTLSFPFLQVVGLALILGSITLGALLYAASSSEKIKTFLLRTIKLILPKRLSEKGEAIVLSFLTSFRILRSGRQLLIISVYTVLIWVVLIFTVYIPFFAFNFGVGVHLTLYDAFLLLIIITMAWLVPSPGATGVYHLFVSQALVGIAGVPKGEALAYATLTHLFGYVAITIVGTVFAIIFSQRMRIGSFSKLFRVEDSQA
jgi:uncharacterized protein (TIRG00374 family)